MNCLAESRSAAVPRRALLLGAILLLLQVVPAAFADAGTLEERVLAYWNARKQADLAAAYEFYSAAFRAQHSRAQFLSGFRRLTRFPPTAIKLVEVRPSADGSEARVRVRLTIQHDFSGKLMDVESNSDETWVLEQGQWWKKDEPFVPNV